MKREGITLKLIYLFFTVLSNYFLLFELNSCRMDVKTLRKKTCNLKRKKKVIVVAFMIFFNWVRNPTLMILSNQMIPSLNV